MFLLSYAVVTAFSLTNTRRGLPYKKDGGCLSYLSGVKKVVLVPLRVLSLKRSTVGTVSAPFRVLNRKNRTGDNELCKIWYLLSEKKIASQAHKIRSWYLEGVFFKISVEQPVLFIWVSPPGLTVQAFPY